MREMNLKDIVRELLTMMAETNPKYEKKVQELIKVIDGWE